MIELHQNGVKMAFFSVCRVTSAPSGAWVDGQQVDESYDEVVAKLKDNHKSRMPESAKVSQEAGDFKHGFAHAKEHIQRYSLESAKAVTGTDDWHRGCIAGVAAYQAEQSGFAEGGPARLVPNTGAVAVLPKPMFMDPLSGDVGPLHVFESMGYARGDLTEVVPDGKGGWTPVE